MNQNIKRNLKYLYTKLLTIHSITPLLYADYFRSYKRILNLSNPDTFGAKIQWIKKYGQLERYKDLVDKYKVRKYVEKKIGKNYLINLYGVYNKPEEIDFDKLPNKFVLKCNHGSGEVIICTDKSRIDKELIKKKMNSWLEVDFYDITKEIQYKGIEKKIVCEEYLQDDSGSLRDYKIFCFNGEPKFIEIDSDRYTNHRMDFYDLNWNKMELRKRKYKNSVNSIKEPNKLDEMLKVARILSEEFSFIRVDLYIVEENIYFGELTFTPANGTSQFYPIEKDLEISKFINLRNYK